MLKGYIKSAIFLLLMRLPFSKCNECDYICDSDGCKIPTNDSHRSISFLKYCDISDIPNDLNFSIMHYQNESSGFPALLKLNFIPPKKGCKYDITLLANKSINKKKCMNYKFENVGGFETHTKATICFFSNNNELQNITGIIFPYIFTACYSVQFFFGKSVRMIEHNKFLETNYKHTEVTKPIFECTYEIVPDIIRNKKQVHLEMSLSVPIVQGVMIYLGSLYSLDGQEICFINKEDLENYFQGFNILDTYVEDSYQHFYIPLSLEDGQYKRNWKLQINISHEENYCFIISLYPDTRCKESTLWKPPVKRCSWYQSCQNITFYKHIAIEANANMDKISDMYLPIIIITLAIFAVVGFMYFIYVIHACNTHGTKIYRNICRANIKSNRATSGTANTLSSEVNIQKMNADVILLYPKGPESFMTLMADFRGIISRVCQCAVHDWYDRVEWNYVAEIGASDWFSEMLNKGSHVIWIDIPIMRSLIAQRLKKDVYTTNSDQYSFVKIGDFRDVVFPAIFYLSKRNMEQSMSYQSKHFIVRLKGFENFSNDDDPFHDLSPDKRYCIPEDLNVLCTELSISQSDKIIAFTSQEEDLINQHF